MTAETSNAREWVDLLERAVPFLLDEGAKYDDDGSNEPLELAREIETLLASLPSDESALSSASSAFDGGREAATPPPPAGDADVWLFKGTDGAWHTFHNEQHRLDTIADGRWEVRKFTALSQQPEAQQPAAEALFMADSVHNQAMPGTREGDMVVLETDAAGKPTIWCDPEIVDLVRALNDGGLRTVASCSGHGGPFGIVTLKDGRELLVLPDFDTARKAERALAAALAAEAQQQKQESGGEVIQRHVVTKYRDGSVHVADVAAPPSAPVGVKTLSEFMAEQEALHPGIHDKVQAATDELRASLAQQPAAEPRSTHRVWRRNDWLPCYCEATSDHHIGCEQQPAAEEQLTYKGVPIGPMQTFADMERQASAPVGVDAPGSRAWMAEVCRAAALSLAAHGVRNDQLSKVADWIAQQSEARGVVDEAMVERAAAAVMSAPPGISVEAYVRIVLEAALAAQRQEPKT